MPASSVEVIGAALQSAYRHKPVDTAPSGLGKKKDFEEELLVSSKQVLVNNVEYEHVGQQQSMLLTSLKDKYVNLTADTTTTTPTPASLPGSMAQAQHKAAAGPQEVQLDEPRIVLWPREKVTLGWRKSFPPGAGMVNLGNTCYLNSSLQALFHIPAMANWLLEELQSHTQRCESNNANASFCSICAMMRTFRSTIDRSNTVIKPNLIQLKLKSIGKTLMFGRQEDAHEFIKLLLDHMEKSYLSFRKANKYDHRSKETTPLNQIFGGYIRQQVICPLCRHVSTTFSHFQDLVLDIRSVNSVDDALNLHFKKETLDMDNAYKCEHCHKKVRATKRHLIERAPHVLLIQLKRFTISGGKIGKHINIQKTIDISRFVNGNSKHQPSSGPYQYRLASMVIHLGGSQHGGHYTAVAESSSGTMYEFDDSAVRSISLQSALSRNPYILFYELIKKPKDPSQLKQVVRQSSEKALIRQNSDAHLKPIPTSHSASSVANGYGHATDNIGELKKGSAQSSIKPLLSQKERERISFGLKFNQGNSSKNEGNVGSKPNRIILNTSTTSLLGSKPSTPSASTLPKPSTATHPHTSSLPKPSTSSSSAAAKPSISNGSSASFSTNAKPSAKSVSSLVPYLDDSEDSEVDEAMKGSGKVSSEKNLALNGKLKNGEVKNGRLNGCSNMSNGSSNGSSNSSNSKNSLKGEKSERMNGNLYTWCKGDKLTNGDCKSDSSSGSKSGTTTFVPRSLQVVGSNNSSSVCSRGKGGELGWMVTDAALHSPSESSNSSAGGTHNTSFTVVEQPTSCRLDQPVSQVYEKPENQGWTVTIRKHRPELEKSHSHDSVLPGRSHKDEPDSASLKSKASEDSCRSDRSTKSMKKSLFSLFTCVSSSRSPESPEEEGSCGSLKEVTADSKAAKASDNPGKQSKKGSTEGNQSQQEGKKTNMGAGHSQGHKGCSSSQDGDGGQSKRFRDHDENEPSSPSKKCCPEEKLKNASKTDTGVKNNTSESSKNGPSNPSSEKSKNFQCCNANNKSSKNGVSNQNGNSKKETGNKVIRNQKSNSDCVMNGGVCNGNGTATHSASTSPTMSSMSSSSSTSDMEGEGEGKQDEAGQEQQWVERTKESIGQAGLNPAAQVVQWNGNMKDLAAKGSSTDPQQQDRAGGGQARRWPGTWDGRRSTQVVDQLRREGNFAYGRKVNSWNGDQSLMDQVARRENRELKKRTSDDLYNEEFDRGRTKKMKPGKKSWDSQYWNRSTGTNEFQRVQNVRNSGTWTQPQHHYNNNNKPYGRSPSTSSSSTSSSQHHYSPSDNYSRPHPWYNNNNGNNYQNKPWRRNKYGKHEGGSKFNKNYKYQHWGSRH